MLICWIALIILSVVVEMITVSLVSIWFMPAGIVALLLAIFGAPVEAQVIAYIVVAAILLILSKTVFKNKLVPKEYERTNADRIIGMKAVVTEDIDPILEKGEVKVDGKLWSARMNDGTTATVGEVVTIVSIRGVKVFCER